MNTKKTTKISFTGKIIISLVSFLMLPTISQGASASIAFGSDKAWGWAVGKSQLEANKLARVQCAKVTKTADCKVALLKGIARAEGDESVAYAWSTTNISEAKQAALKTCGNTNCKVTQAHVTPGFFSLFKSNGDDTATYFLAYGYSDSELADAEAKAGCEKNFGNTCSVVISSAISGVIPALKSSPSPVTNKSCRPNASKIECASRCINGNCEVTYQNGCKMRVQVPAKYDPTSNAWIYPAPSC